jgi:hypothetical protein
MDVAPKKVGDKAFMQFIAKCVMRDWVVLTPVGDCDRFDCVIDRGNGFEKVQVKAARMRNGCVHFATCSSHYHTKQGQVTGNYKKSYKGEVDLFGIYCFDTNKCYIIKVDDVGNVEANLRVDLPKKGKDNASIKWAKDYEI